MQETWKRIEKWMEGNAPLVLGSLQEGADEAAIEETEKFLGVRLPEDLKAAYRIHDGQRDDGPWWPEVGQLLPMEGIRSEWKTWKELVDDGTFEGTQSEPVGPIKADWWNIRWIPFTYDGSGNHLCADLDPAEGGKSGQVITMWHDDAERVVVAESFGDWLDGFADGLEAGEYRYSAEDGMLVRVEG